MNSPAALSPAQQEIMDIVWEAGELSARRVRGFLASRNRIVARNTVRTLLTRMEEKGWLVHRLDGRTHVYAAAVPKTTTVRRQVGELVDSLCGGSPELLVTALLEQKRLTSDELDCIRQLINQERQRRTARI